MKLRVHFDGYELTEYLKVSGGFSRGIGTGRQNDLLQVGNSNGAKYRGHRLEENSFPMPFTIKHNLIEKRRALASILNVSEPKKLIFSDEPDKYYLAVPGITDLIENNFLGNGEITWVIPDGIAHSISEKKYTNTRNEVNEKSITINNEGTTETAVSFEIEHLSDNGYDAIVTDDAIIQLGNTQEIDGFDFEQSERILSDTIEVGGEKKWQANKGYIRQNPGVSRMEGDLSFGLDNKGRSRTITKSWGTESDQLWHGPSIYREFEKDSNGIKGAKNWELSFYSHAFASNDSQGGGQAGFQEFNINAADGSLIASLEFSKRTSGNIRVTPRFIVKNDVVWEETSDRWNEYIGRITIQKFGSEFRFSIEKLESRNNTKQTFTFIDESLKDSIATGFTYWNAKWGKLKPLEMGMYEVFFTKNNVEKWEDIPNQFKKGDFTKIECTDSNVKTYIKSTEDSDYSLALDYQDIGSQPIVVPPGETTIYLSFSDFAVTPKVTATFREKYL